MSILWLAIGFVLGTFFGAAAKPFLIRAWEAVRDWLDRAPKDPPSI